MAFEYAGEAGTNKAVKESLQKSEDLSLSDEQSKVVKNINEGDNKVKKR